MFFVFKQKTAYEMRISDWSSDVCSSDLTAQLSGSTTATNIPGQNVIALNLPLTAANALDVWRPFDGTNRTSEAVIRSLYRNNSENTNYNTFNQMKLDLNGSLFSLPAGKLKIAVGRSEEHTSELQSLMRISYAVFCLKKKQQKRE